jgi:hypothetical protein
VAVIVANEIVKTILFEPLIRPQMAQACQRDGALPPASFAAKSNLKVNALICR